MKRRLKTGLILGIPLVAIAVLATSLAIGFENAEAGKKCECFGGDASCFFDGSRCPVSGGKCKCFKSPVSADGAGAACCCAEGREGAAHAANSAVEFCQSHCPIAVGGETCGAQCRLKKGHAGKHLCIKLHDF